MDLFHDPHFPPRFLFLLCFLLFLSHQYIYIYICVCVCVCVCVYHIVYLISFLLFVLRTCKIPNLPQDSYAQDRMRRHPYLGVHTFHMARVLFYFILVEILLKSQVCTPVEECVHILHMTYANLGLTRFIAFSVSFIFVVMFYYLSLSVFIYI